MVTVFRKQCICAIFIILLLPVSAMAIPAITCHCFKDRSYDPARPALADPYLLATCQNSFFAAVFVAEKKEIVMKKQQGVSAADLWIAYWLVAKGAAASPEAILQVSQRGKSWPEIIAAYGLTEKTLGTRFATALKARAGTESLAETVVDELLIQYRLLSEPELLTLRTSGGTSQELILAALIAVRTKQPTSRLFRNVKSGAKSWGSLLDTANIKPATLQQEFAALIGRSR